MATPRTYLRTTLQLQVTPELLPSGLVGSMEAPLPGLAGKGWLSTRGPTHSIIDREAATGLTHNGDSPLVVRGRRGWRTGADVSPPGRAPPLATAVSLAAAPPRGRGSSALLLPGSNVSVHPALCRTYIHTRMYGTSRPKPPSQVGTAPFTPSHHARTVSRARVRDAPHCTPVEGVSLVGEWG